MKDFKKTLLVAALAILMVPQMASAIAVTPDGPAAALIAALTAPGTGLTITSLSISGHSVAGAPIFSWGTYTNASGTYGIGSGIMISSGSVADYGDGPNTSGSNTTSYGVAATAAQDAILDDISGDKDYFDVTEIDVTFDLDAAHDTVFFNVIFGSDEFAEYKGSTFIDAFGLLVNGVNIAFIGGLPVNIDNPAMAFLPGTELDGVMGGTFSKVVGTGSTGNTLKFIVADSGDSILDSTAYISALGGEAPPPPLPEPSSLVLLGSAIGLLSLLKKRLN
jgi:hypothetical protein